MIHLCPLSKQKYLYELRQQKGAWSDFGQSRFTGLILGNFFYLTNHSQYEWDRRYNNPKCCAMGFVTAYGDETLVRAICTYGAIDPISLLKLFPFLCLLFFVKTPSIPITHKLLIVIALTVAGGILSAIGTSLITRGRENMSELRSLLENPKRFWADEEENQ